MSRLARNREELAAFLHSRRARLSPADVGLPQGLRRRTPGLRREEVAALAGVGLSWYTWLEQGRDIGVSERFLDALCRVLKLDAAERRHLYLLAHQRLPNEPGQTWCTIPPLVGRLMDDLAPHAAYVLNLRWDVLGFNTPADQLFGFARQPPERRNLLWWLFTDALARETLVDWAQTAPAMLSSFRRDFANARGDADAQALVAELQAVSPDFKTCWQRQDVHAPCTGQRQMRLGSDIAAFDHTSLTLDGDRHLRLVVYARTGATGAHG